MVADWRHRQKQELRQLLYDTALALFAAQGYERTTVQQITEKVGVAKGTFFNHFPTKEHVIAEWYNDVTFASLEAAKRRQSSSGEEAICDLLVDMARRATEAPELLMAKSKNSANPLLVAAEKTQDDETDALLLQLCVDAKASGELAADLDEHFFVGLIGDILTGTSRSWVRSQPHFDFPTVVRARVQFLFRAARPAAP